MKPPIGFVYGNCVFADALDDGWAAFAVQTESYEWLSEDGKRARFLALLGALEAIEADVQILRVGRRWDLGRYARELEDDDLPRGGDARYPGADRTTRAREAALRCRSTRSTWVEIGAARPEVFLIVSLREPERDVAAYVSRAAERHPREWLEGIRRAFSVRDRRVMKVSELERARVRADQAHARLADYLPVRQARGVELQWLVRRAFCRGLGEPEIDGLHEPRALVFERNGEATLAPLEGDVMRWLDGYVEHRGRALRIESETGTSWQAQLVLGALPEQAQFPGARVELMFAPPESLPFGVDLSLNARFLPNGLALRIARRRIQDADQIVRAESDGEQGVTDLGYQRTQEARDLLAYLQSSSRPPLLRATLAARDRGGERGGARGARGDDAARLRRDPSAPPARRSAAAVHAAPARPAHAGLRLRRHAHARAGRGDDADRRPRGGLARGLLPRDTRSRARASRSGSTSARAPRATATRRSSASARSARARRRSIRSSSTRASCRARGSSTATRRATTASTCWRRSRRTPSASR